MEAVKTSIIESPKRRHEPMIQAQSSGLLSRLATVAGGISVAYFCASTAPVAAVAILAALGLSRDRILELKAENITSEADVTAVI